MRARSRVAGAAMALSIAAGALAGPNLPVDDPGWATLRDRVAEGQLPDRLGGVQSVAEDAPGEGLWLAPLERLTLRLSSADEHDRPYSLPVRPRQIAGGIALSCDYQEGRPCGDGVGTALELDSAAGWGGLVTAATRLRVSAGTD